LFFSFIFPSAAEPQRLPTKKKTDFSGHPYVGRPKVQLNLILRFRSVVLMNVFVDLRQLYVYVHEIRDQGDPIGPNFLLLLSWVRFSKITETAKTFGYFCAHNVCINSDRTIDWATFLAICLANSSGANPTTLSKFKSRRIGSWDRCYDFLNIFAENWEKSQKIVIITSTPGHPVRGKRWMYFFVLISTVVLLFGEPAGDRGCQMVCFQTKNKNLGKFWRASEWKKPIYFTVIWNILRSFDIFSGHLVMLW
jgi:hypothetical protein